MMSSYSYLHSYLTDRKPFVVSWRVSISNFENGVWSVTRFSPRAFFFSIFTTLVGTLISTFQVSYYQFSNDTHCDQVENEWRPCRTIHLCWCGHQLVCREWPPEHAKTEALAVGIRQQVAKLHLYVDVVVSGSTIPFGKKLRVLGVMLNNHLTFDDHITCVVQACKYHLRATSLSGHRMATSCTLLSRCRRRNRNTLLLLLFCLLISKDAANIIAYSMVGFWLDYCNAILYEVTRSIWTDYKAISERHKM